MRAYSLSHLNDCDLFRNLITLVAKDRTTTAELVAHVAEVESRRLYVPAGYPSMFEYCVRELHMPEHVALRRIRAGRTARQFPAIFTALADGRLHLTAVVLLRPHLTPDNADELLAAATHKTKAEIELLLAHRFPKADVPARLDPIAPTPPPTSNAEPLALESTDQLAPELVPLGHPNDSIAPRPAAPFPKATPLAPERFALQVTISQDTHDLLRHAQALLSHRVSSGDIDGVLNRALKALVTQLEKRKFAATDRPQKHARRRAVHKRTIPAHVRRTVRERDGDQCTYVSDTGQRCPARKFLEFDHVDPVARGGEATEENVRLRCRAHNQYEAERKFGDGFMHEKRAQARAAKEARALADAAEGERALVAAAEAQAHAAAIEERAIAREQARDIVAGLRTLGCRADEARRAAEFSESLENVTLEERMRAALKFICPKPRVYGPSATSASLPT